MKRTCLALVVTLFLMSIVISMAVAAPAPAGYYCPYAQWAPNLSDDQRQQISQWQNQLIDNRKQVFQRQVEWGWITQAQADQQTSYMQQWQSNGYGMWMMGPGMMDHGMMGPGMMGPGMMGHGNMGMGMMWGGQGYYSPYSQQSTNLSDDQRQQISQWQNQLIDNRKQILQKQVEWGWITQAQADQQISYMQQWQRNGYGMWMSGYGGCCR